MNVCGSPGRGRDRSTPGPGRGSPRRGRGAGSAASGCVGGPGAAGGGGLVGRMRACWAVTCEEAPSVVFWRSGLCWFPFRVFCVPKCKKSLSVFLLAWLSCLVPGLYDSVKNTPFELDDAVSTNKNNAH